MSQITATTSTPFCTSTVIMTVTSAPNSMEIAAILGKKDMVCHHH